jgi:hypothetical protein
MTPLRRMMRQCSQSFFTDALTFIKLAFQLPENDSSRHACRREENRDFIACFQA